MSNDDWPVAFWIDQTEVVTDIGLEQAHYTKLFTEEAIRFIEQSREGPFFLYLAHKDPHQPFFPSERFAGRSAGGPYGDAVSELDWSVGEVVRALHRLGIAEQTLVIVTSDNGPWYEGSAGGLRGRKGQSYEGGFRVPFVACWPGRIPAGSVSEVPAMNIDLLPTFLGLAGLSLPSDRVIDGVDLWPVLAGGGAELARVSREHSALLLPRLRRGGAAPRPLEVHPQQQPLRLACAAGQARHARRQARLRAQLPASRLDGVGAHAGHLAAALRAGPRPGRGLQPGADPPRDRPRAGREAGDVAGGVSRQPARLALGELPAGAASARRGRRYQRSDRGRVRMPP